ncbi:MAG TPA: hypothetical protein PKA90_16375 [Ignavibacteria bacterium]|nr:hypothetical protein [Ignavibacteria bacterium]HMR41994.1 hypothetical protein [Ignavibacteria bacterium]
MIILFLNFTGISLSQDIDIKLYSPLYDIKDINKVVADSILLDGYLVLELDTNNLELGFVKSKKFFKIIPYFVYNLDDIKNSSSLKLFYNSYQMMYNTFMISDNPGDDTIQFKERQTFKKVYGKYLQNLKSNVPFRINDIEFNELSKDKIDFFQLDNSGQRGFFIFKCQVSAFLFIGEVELNKINSKKETISLLFFEPLSKTIVFKPEDMNELTQHSFRKSSMFVDYIKK